MKNILYLSFKIFLKGSRKGIYCLLGMTLGIAILVFSFSLMDGYREGMEKALRKIYPPVYIKGQEGLELPSYIKDKGKVLKEDLFEGLAISKKENLSKFVFIKAKEGQKETILGKTLAENLKITKGDFLTLVYKGKVSQQIINLKVDSIQKTGLSFLDESFISLPIDLLKDRSPSYGIYPENKKNLKKIKEILEKEPLWTATTFEDITGDVLEPLKIVEWSIGIILSLITLVSSFHLLTKLLLDMRERKKTFAILYALGMKPLNIFLSFFIYSFILGLSGVVMGILAGILIIFLSNNLHLFAFSGKLKGVYFLEEIVLKIFPESLFFIFSLGLATVLFISLLTFIVIKNMKIVESLRYE